MASLARGVLLGASFGLAAALVDLGFSGVGMVQRRMGPGPALALETALIEVALGALLGLLVAPLLRLRAGRVLAVLALAVLWFALGWWVQFEAPIGQLLLQVVPVGAALLTLLGLALARLARWLPGAVAALLLAAVAFGPTAYIEATTELPPPRAELPPPPEGAPDIVLVVLDTVRAPSTSLHGYARATTPTLAALAREGALFSDATSPSTWSLPSHASLFTGRFPSSHGAHGENLILDSRYPTLAQVLASQGYETTCFTANAWISDGLGLTRGFTYQDQSWRSEAGAGRNFSFAFRLLDRLGLVSGDKSGAAVARRFAEWLAERPTDARPYFTFLNFIEAHFPYHQLPDEYLHRFTDRDGGELEEISMALMGQQFGGPGRDVAEVGPPAVDMYDGGVLYSDELLRRVVEALEARGTLDRTVLVVLADHGEVLGERAGFFGHGPSLHQESISVPFVVRYPPRLPAGSRVERPVSTVGVFGTILDLAGLQPAPTLQVGSLVPLAEGSGDGAPDSTRVVLAERMKSTALGPPGEDSSQPLDMRRDTRVRVYRSGEWKLVATSAGGSLLYHLGEDPGERRDLAGERPRQLARLEAELASLRDGLGLPPLDGELASGADAPELDEATRARLRELGYVE